MPGPLWLLLTAAVSSVVRALASHQTARGWAESQLLSSAPCDPQGAGRIPPGPEPVLIFRAFPTARLRGACLPKGHRRCSPNQMQAAGCWRLWGRWIRAGSGQTEKGALGEVIPEQGPMFFLLPLDTGNYARRTDTITVLPEELRANFRWAARAHWFPASLPDQVLAFPRERRLSLLGPLGTSSPRSAFTSKGRRCFCCLPTVPSPSAMWGARPGVRRLWVPAPRWADVACGNPWQQEVVRPGQPLSPGPPLRLLLGAACFGTLLWDLGPSTWSLKGP